MSSFGISPYARSVASVARIARSEQETEDKKVEESSSSSSSSSSKSTATTKGGKTNTVRNSMKYAVGHRYDSACDHF